MIELTKIQPIYQEGVPAFVVIPFQDFARAHPAEAALIAAQARRIPQEDGVPHEVVGLHVKGGMTMIRAWREYLGLTQQEVAEKAGISQAALSQMESGQQSTRRSTREKLARAMGLNPEQMW